MPCARVQPYARRQAIIVSPVAMIVGPSHQIPCNHSGQKPPMSAIPDADDCGSLQVTRVPTAITNKAARLDGEGGHPLKVIECLPFR